MKEIIEQFKKSFWTCFFCIIVGIMLGKLYVYVDIATDCKVLGMFRIQTTAFDCRMSKV